MRADIDVQALGKWLAANVPRIGPVLEIAPLTGGQSNPTYVLRDAAGLKAVLRKAPSGPTVKSAHAVDREFQVMSALRGSAVPVPEVWALCEDRSVLGAPFFVMEFVEGRIFWDPALPNESPEFRRDLYEDINRTVAQLHTVDFDRLGLTAFGRSEDFFGRQIARWTKQYHASRLRTIESMDRLIEWLPDNLPDRDLTTLFHGDLRLDNMIVHSSEPKVVALLDWELSTLGDPLADLAYHALPWRLSAHQFRGMAGKSSAVLRGIPSEAEYISTYAVNVGQDIDRAHYQFAVVFAMFRLAAILHGIYERAMLGSASATDARETGEKAATVADQAWIEVRTHFPGTR
ncbi:MAG: phosphotransferase family protein [Hyphomicrobiales bacterium]|nr:MAG: phosphotransferase family protein [Hyphomicrobiales bacterium]